MNKTIGKLGEDLTVRYLAQKGHKIIEQNAGYKAGEIDVVSEKDGVVHFVEVKSKRVGNIDEVRPDDKYRPEERVNAFKQRQIRHAVEIYTHSHKVTQWQIDVAAVFIDVDGKRAKVEIIENAIV